MGSVVLDNPVSDYWNSFNVGPDDCAVSVPLIPVGFTVSAISLVSVGAAVSSVVSLVASDILLFISAVPLILEISLVPVGAVLLVSEILGVLCSLAGKVSLVDIGFVLLVA
jgi:hypothetical protein